MASNPTCEALVLHGAKDLRMESRAVSPPSPDEVQIAIRATGLCGSDLHYYNHGRNGDFVVRQPYCLGHESSGEVTATGTNVSTLQVGDRVALEVGLPCTKCPLCLQGRYNICPDMRFRSSAKTYPHLDGTLMERTNHPATLCHRLPENVSFAGGALAEPLAVVLHAIRRSRPPARADVDLAAAHGAGTAALVFGAGAIGLLLAAALSLTENFSSIVIADIDPARLAIADSLSLPTLHTFLIPKPSTQPSESVSKEDAALQSAQSLATQLKSSIPDVAAGFARVYDCTGVPACIQTGIYAAAPGSVLVQIGMGHPVQTVPLGAAALREVDLIGVFRYDGAAYPAAIALLGGGRFSVVEEKVVTHRVALRDGKEAFELAGRGVDGEGRTVVKVVIES
ncbi:putative zinc-dependent alcohol dehydrogenase [Aspergillus campestris IBT 28561]|uniref:Zinc-dependent alcohol dehydrogenase n=1 Tax=Aspergillus campestris (strain IBT 28561) TaxID=1392248 RepID=A0A2I1DFE7_ASPC2|nr:putative zinc-dependent alcohol dehydrogenase [Aspergillus campestris IBT 28561]PKY08603.1 putative zinc-dependent alcohol dehydrogenase [Aspergillus campestris IBT 28561]